MLRRLLPVLLALGLSGCSVVEFAYENAPAYLEAKVTDAFELDDNQQWDLHADMERFAEWHRRNELPLYVASLKQFADGLDNGAQAEDFAHFVSTMEKARARFADRLFDDFSGLLMTIRPEQLLYYEEAFADHIEDDVELYELEVDERRQKLAEKNLDRLEDWFGSLDDEQREFSLAQFKALPDFHAQWVAQRQRRHEAFLLLMRSQPDEETLKRELKARFVHRRVGASAEYEQGRKAYWMAYGQAVEAIGKRLRPDQVRHAIEKLHEYAAIFDRLSRQ